MEQLASRKREKLQTGDQHVAYRMTCPLSRQVQHNLKFNTSSHDPSQGRGALFEISKDGRHVRHI